jgi:hypothetical protein
MGRLVYPSLRNLYPVIVAGLVKAAEAAQSLTRHPCHPAEACMPSGNSLGSWDGALGDIRTVGMGAVTAA